MSVFSSLTIGVSGLQAQNSRINTISQNIANIETVGYKNVRADFASRVAHTIANTRDTGGVGAADRQVNIVQGEIIRSETVTDIAISGNGFFAVRETPDGTGAPFYTRAGGFIPDNQGNFKNGSGYYLLGWAFDATGELPAALQSPDLDAGTAIAALQTVNVQELDGIPVPTSQVEFNLNLDAGQIIYADLPAYNPADPLANMATGAVPPHFNRPFTVVDSSGLSHSLFVGFLKTAINTWAVEVYSDTPADISGGNPQVASGTLTFNGDGTLGSVSPALSQMTVSWSNSTANTFTADWGTAGPIFGTVGATVFGASDGVTQFDSVYRILSVHQNGFEAGRLANIEISEDGVLSSTYDNGNTRRLFMIPLVKFIDPNQLTAMTGTIFTTSNETSAPAFRQPGQGGTGTLEDNALERSSVDEATEMTHLIIAQRSYQFNSKLISTTDDMMLTATQMLA